MTDKEYESGFAWDVPSLSPREIDGYELTARIAEGAMGAVFRGKQVSLDRDVAIKVLKPELAKDKSFLRRFQREARAVAKLNHRNVVSAIDVGESGGWHYLVMEYVRGPTLARHLSENGKMPEKDAILIAWQICSALRHANRHEIVHRDVKPENVILPPGGDAKLCDLGLAKNVSSDSTVLTLMGTAMGTPLYISPEQARGDAEIDIRSDIYSLGATLYHMVCGSPPFDGNSAAVLLAKHLTEEPTPLVIRNPALSAGTVAVTERMLAKDPADRHQGPDEVMTDLRKVAAGKWETTPPAATPVEPEPGEADQPVDIRLRRRRRVRRPRRRRR